MSDEFYGPRKDAEGVINRLLGLPATFREQDWEFELADPARINDMLDMLESVDIDLECVSALALLTISSMEEASALGLLEGAQIRRAAKIFEGRGDVRERMRYYWIGLKRANNEDLIRKIINY